MKSKVKNVKARYITRAVIGGAKTDAMTKIQSFNHKRRQFRLDAEGYFVWDKDRKKN